MRELTDSELELLISLHPEQEQEFLEANMCSDGFNPVEITFSDLKEINAKTEQGTFDCFEALGAIYPKRKVRCWLKNNNYNPAVVRGPFYINIQTGKTAKAIGKLLVNAGASSTNKIAVKIMCSGFLSFTPEVL